MSPASFLLASLFLATTVQAADPAPVPQPREIKIFKDWAVGCDNGGVCRAISLLPEESGGLEDWEGPITLVRSANETDRPTIRALVETMDIDRYRMMVDGKLVDTGAIAQGDYPIEIFGEDAKKVATAIARGHDLEVLGPSGESLTKISLAGSAAALRYMDAQQNRAGTPTALVAKGRRVFEPVAPDVPLIRVDQWEKSELIPETGEIVALAENSDCKDDRFGVVEDQAFPMGKRGGKFRALVLISCGSGAYNFSSAAYIGEYDDAGRGTKGWDFKPAKFDLPPSWGGDGGPALLVNAYWTGHDQRLGSYAKGRGLGDCGSAESYVWDGNMFRLVEANRMNACRGSYQWITTWRAKYLPVQQASEETASAN